MKQADGSSPISSLSKMKRGPPPVLGEKLDDKVQDWIRKVCLSGGIVNCRTVMGGIEGIV